MRNETPKTYDVVIVGAGFAGLYQLHRLRQEGFSAHVLEAGAAPGGIWYWNCYPGARVDTHVPAYEYSMQALWQDWTWSERFPGRDELRSYFDHVVSKWGLKDHISYNERVTRAAFDDSTARWTISTENGATFNAHYFILCTGFAAKAYIPDIDGLDLFEGPCHHTAHWPQDGVDLTNKRAGVIGTGASGVQVIQEAAKVADQVTVFQRTPILALPMQQSDLTADTQAAEKSDYPNRFHIRQRGAGGFDFVAREDNALDQTKEAREAVFEALWQAGGLRFWAQNFADIGRDEAANKLAYEFWRDKTRARIKDSALREKLAPMEPPHPFGTKRPSLEQTYYEAFNQDNVHLVDLKETPITNVTASGVSTAQKEIDLDVLVLATGFDAVTGGITQIDIQGPGGQTIKDKWASGVRTQLGLASHGFPNLLFLYGPQSPAGFCNGPTCAELQSDWITRLLLDLRSKDARTIEPTAAAEEAWNDIMDAIVAETLLPKADSWYMGANIPGKKRQLLNFPGVATYTDLCEACAANGYDGFMIS